MKTRACLKKAFCKMCVTICGRFCPDEGVVAGYDNRIRVKSPAKWGVQIAGMIFQTGSRTGVLKSTDMERYLEIKVTEPSEVGDVLRNQAGLTRRQISQAKFRPGGICKNEKQCRVTESVSAGDVIRVCLENKETDSGQLEAPAEKLSDFSERNSNEESQKPANHVWESAQNLPQKLEILYEDQDLLAVNKPAGMVTHPSGSHYRDSLSNQIAAYFRSKGEPTRIRSVGRLDKETSGILLFARNQVAAARLQKQREEGRLQKNYLAIVEGNFPAEYDRKIQVPLAPDPENPMKMTTSPDGTLPGSKHAVTYYEVLKSCEDKSLVQLHLKTGRTHQIRVHMASLGHPLLGDTLYHEKEPEEALRNDPGQQTGWKNREEKVFTRAALHAWKLTFYHPFTEEKITLEAPMPADFFPFLEIWQLNPSEIYCRAVNEEC